MDAINRMLVLARQLRETRSQRKQKPGNQRTLRSAFSLEPLESRMLLSATPLAVTQFVADASGFTAPAARLKSLPGEFW